MSQLIIQSKFKNLLFGRIFSVFGDSLIYITLLKWFEMKNGGSITTTGYFISFYLPAALFAIPIGTWIQSKPLQKIMILSDFIRGCILFIFIGIMSFIPYQIAYIYLFLDSTLLLFFVPANQSLLPYIVKEQELSKANSILQSSYMIFRIAGHGISAYLLTVGCPIKIIMLISGIFVFLSLLLIYKIKPVIVCDVDEKRSYRDSMMKGLNYIWNNKILRGVFSLFIIAWFIGSSIELIIVTYLTDVIHKGVQTMSYFTITQFSGMMFGAFVASYLLKKLDYKWWLIFPIFTFSLALISLDIIKGLIFILPFFFIAGFCFGIFNVVLPTLIQEKTEKMYHSRIFSVHTMIFNFMPLPGLLAFGIVIAKLGLVVTIIIIRACSKSPQFPTKIKMHL